MLPVYPFPALVGQPSMCEALLWTAVDPLLGGVLLMGHRGTAKSTAVRGLSRILPAMPAVRGCRYRCDPDRPAQLCPECGERLARGGRLEREAVVPRIVDLPLGATEDRVVGSLDLDRALRQGEVAFQPGLLALANRGYLYIDEVNLLDDSLVDLLLDVAAGGVNTVEREGVSVKHPARFVLIGSGNPEEGSLRPQLLDRFALCVPVETVRDVALRVEIVRRRERFERDPEGFLREWEPEEAKLRVQVARARERLARVDFPDALLHKVAELCMRLEVDGHRGELSVMRAAVARAALAGRLTVADEDVRAVAIPALRHRLRRSALDELDGAAEVERLLEALMPEAAPVPGLPAGW